MFLRLNHLSQDHSRATTQQHHQQQRYTRTDSDFVGDIPSGDGEWIRFNITHMITEWMAQQPVHHKSTSDAHSDIVQEVVIKTLGEFYLVEFIIHSGLL